MRVLFCLLALLGAIEAHATVVFPVTYSADERYLVDRNGAPFPIMGRTAWFVLSVSAASYRDFVDDTEARGYDAIELHVLDHDPRGNNPPFAGNGAAPFLRRLDGTEWKGSLAYARIDSEAPDFGTPNESYWRFVDGFLAYCASKGILVFLFPAYVGYPGTQQGWMREMLANGPARMHAYGSWIATRYRDQKNLVWMMGGDSGSFDAAETAVESALLAGLRSVPGQQSMLVSAEWASESIATDQPTFGSAMTLNGAYSWSGHVIRQGRRAYRHEPVRPAFLLEEPYDEEGADGNRVNASATQPVRRFQWWGWLSTIGGYIAGNAYVWPFRPEWRTHLSSRATQDMVHLNAFMRSIAWYKLVPSGLAAMRTFVTSSARSVDASDYVAGAAAPDGSLAVVYVPPAHSGPIAVAMSVMSAPARARWFDPTSGAYIPIAGNLANSGTHFFAPPARNSANERDWVLVLD